MTTRPAVPVMRELVLVTGGSGFLGSHTITHLLRAGYRVRTTIRSLQRCDDVRAMLKTGGATIDQVNSVEFVATDLQSDDNWAEACRDCIFIHHVASPLPAAVPKHENDLIVPAREGTLRVLRAARNAGTVTRVIVTSSLAAIAYGHPDGVAHPFTEKEWTNVEHLSKVQAYPKSKTIAERTAWDFIAKEGGALELTTVCPVTILGPILAKQTSSSIEIILRLMNGSIPALPRLTFDVVDVRDVADLHLRCMTDPKAKGERFLATSPSEPMALQEVALLLRDKLGDCARKVPTRVAPDWALKLLAMFDKAVELIVGELGVVRASTSKKAMVMLGWRPRSSDETIISTGESLKEFGLTP